MKSAELKGKSDYKHIHLHLHLLNISLNHVNGSVFNNECRIILTKQLCKINAKKYNV